MLLSIHNVDVRKHKGGKRCPTLKLWRSSILKQDGHAHKAETLHFVSME